MNIAFYIKLHAAYKCKKYLKLLKFTQCTHRSLRANNLILLLRSVRKYKVFSYTFTHKIQFISFPS